ncbi:MAG: hypothetical protein NTW21_42175 [Verrucomicrobia bacterium]|nr:hypothetical protein [Verrucomicrobiota bacterium]
MCDEALAWNRQYAMLGGDWSPFWHDAIDLLGMENLHFKMYDEPGLLDAVLQHVVDYYAAVSRHLFDAAADALDIFLIGNDFGSQTGPLLSPAQFDRFILPLLARLIDLGHAYHLPVQLHCCALPTALQTLARARAGESMECGGKRSATPLWLSPGAIIAVDHGV